MTQTPPPPYTAGGTLSSHVRENKTSLPSEKPRPESNATTVLIVGETANGKSTMIRNLARYGGNSEYDIDVGYGNVSCTRVVKDHPISTVLKSYHLQDARGRRIKNESYSDLANFTDDDATLVENPPDNEGRKVDFLLIDTPGLDDSDGNDMEIMANIIGRAGDLPHLNAVIYVRNLNKPFGRSFSEFYKYMQRCMPMLCDGVTIVHTGFTVDRIEEALSKKIDLMAERKKAFVKASKVNTELAHFFLDNDPDDYNPFALMESFNGCYRLLKHLSSQLPLATRNLRLLKTPGMTKFEVHVILALERLIPKLQKRHTDKLAVADRFKCEALRAKTEITRIQTQIESEQSRLDSMNTEDPFLLGSKNEYLEFGVKTVVSGLLELQLPLWLEEKKVNFDSDYEIADVQRTALGGSKWTNEQRGKKSWSATLSANIFRSINGSATFYSTNRLRYKSEIQIISASIGREKEAISFHEQTLAMNDGALDEDGDDAEIVSLGKDIQRATATLEKIKSESFEVALWPALKGFYGAQSAPAQGEVFGFLEVYDPETARLLFTAA